MFSTPKINNNVEVTRFGYPPNSPMERLTRRQFQILRAVAQGKNNKSIAEELGIKTNSVSNHLLTIYRELNISDECNQRVLAALKFYGLEVPSSS